MLKNRNINIILAIIIAISLWAYVLGDVNPKIDFTIKEVPIEIVNEDTLTSSDLVVLSYSQLAVNITVSGPRTDVTQLSKSDFKVTADVEALRIGENTVRLNVVGPDKGEITNVSTDKIKVNVDRLVTEEKPISVVVTGEVDSGKEPLIVETSNDVVNVKGAQSLVDNVERVNAVIDASQIDNNMNTLNAMLEPVDEEGNIVEYVDLDIKSINVTTVMHHVKTVDLVVPVQNQDDGDYERSVSAPKTIVIKGEDADLSEVSSITCEPIDLSQYTEDTIVRLEPIVPDGIEISKEYTDLNAEVSVKLLSKGTVKVTKNDIKINNASEGLKYEINTDDISIEVTGKENELIGLDITDFTIIVDVTDLEAGEHQVKLNVSSTKEFATIKLSAETVNIIIK